MKCLRTFAFAAPLTAITVAGALQGSPALAQEPRFSAPADFSAMVQARLPSVVGIVATGPAPENSDQPAMPMLPPGLEDFFGGPGPMPGPSPQGPRQALGSGFIISSDGFVVTNNHVISGAEEIEVMIGGDRAMPAELVGTDPATDIALLKIEDAKGLSAVEWGSSDNLEIGDWVVAIGSPFGLGSTVTAGIVSARSRDINSGPYDDFIQTDAAINSGNSGGPLFDATGEVVGVNTAIFSPSGGNVGIGFAVPSAVASRIVADLREDGTVERGWLGVGIQPVSDDLSAALGLDGTGGALVNQVTPGGPAAEAGLEPGDVIVSFAGNDIAEPRDLVFAVAEQPVGEDADLGVWRDGEEQEFAVEIGRQPGTMFAGLRDEEGEAGDEATRLGVSLAPVSPETRARFGLPEDLTRGMVIVEVERGSLAAGAGLSTGMVIVEAGGMEASSARVVTDALANAEATGQPLLLRVFRRGAYQFIAVPVSGNGG